MQEQWATIEGFNGNYTVSNFGRVKSMSRRVDNHTGGYVTQERILQGTKRLGYTIVMFGKNRKGIPVHRLVAKAFIPNPANKPEVNHIDNQRSNNRVENLEWCTHHENVLHAVRQGRIYVFKYKHGEENLMAKLTCHAVVEMRELSRLTGMAYRKIAYIFGVTTMTAYRAISGKGWKTA